MTLLLDTHLLLWAAMGSERLPQAAAAMIDDPVHKVMFSSVSIWEVTIKHSLGRADFRVNPHILLMKLRDNGYGELPISSEHALAVSNLPHLHKDPFDRILIAQSAVERFTLLTVDPIVSSYPGAIVGF